MRRIRALTLTFAPFAALVAVAISPATARADITVFDHDGWSIYTRGLIASHFQYAFGQGDPDTTHGVLIGGKILPGGATDQLDNSLKLSRIRSGFVGTQMGWGVRRQISDSVSVDSLIAINLADVSGNRNQEGNKSVDVREAWAAVSTPYGTFKFGRMLEIFGSGGVPIVLLSHRFAVGNPCFVNAPTIACGPVGAGPLFPEFDAQLRYETPRLGGVQFQVAASDPWVGPGYLMTPFPRFDADLDFDHAFGSIVRARVFVQGTWEVVERTGDMMQLQKGQVVGGMGTALLDIADFSIGGGGWQCKGCGTRTVMEVGDAVSPLAFDGSTYELRMANGVFVNAKYTLRGYTLAAGAGAAFVRPTTHDADPGNTSGSILKESKEYHAVLTKQIDAVVLTAEYMKWHNDWHFGEQQDQTYTGVGANYFW
jgi:predicted porin